MTFNDKIKQIQPETYVQDISQFVNEFIQTTGDIKEPFFKEAEKGLICSCMLYLYENEGIEKITLDEIGQILSLTQKEIDGKDLFYRLISKQPNSTAYSYYNKYLNSFPKATCNSVSKSALIRIKTAQNVDL